MPPKKGKKKQVEDDWEAELGESLDDPKPAEEAPAPMPATNDDDDDGGLMSQLGKGKKVEARPSDELTARERRTKRRKRWTMTGKRN